MAVSEDEVRHVASLARLGISSDRIPTIAAELNVAEGAIKCAFADQAIVAANAILAGKEYDCVGASTVLGQQMIAIKDILAAYNEDICACPASARAPETSASAPTNTKKASWGGLKSIYR